MSSTFEVIYLGESPLDIDGNPVDIDSDEVNSLASDTPELLLGQTFGSAAAPLYDQRQIWSPGGPDGLGYENTGSSSAYDAKGDLDSFKINGGPDQFLDGVGVYKAELTYIDGSTVTVNRAIIAQDTTGKLYLLPDTRPIGAYTAKVIYSIKLISVVDGSPRFSHNRVEGSFAPCFTRGTMIRTRNGINAVERLKVGDELVTRDNRNGKILWIGKSTVPAEGKLAPIRIKECALGNELPYDDLIVSPQHRMLITSEFAQKHFGDSECLVPAVKLLPLKGVSRVQNWKTVEYYHIALENHEVIYANGAPTESLYIGSTFIHNMPEEMVEEILEIFPELLDAEMEAVRPLLQNKDAKRLVKKFKALLDEN